MDSKMESDINTNIENTLQYLTELYFDHKYDDICKILKIEHNYRYNENNDFIYKYDKNEDGMTFCDNDFIDARVKVDEETKYILNILLMTTSNLINESVIIDLILNKWTKNHTIGLICHNDIPKIIGNEFRIHLKVSKGSWNNLIKSCKNKNILVKTGFKLAITNYLNEL